MEKQKPKVAFICVHNSCRSQMAEALVKLFASDVFESYSAGTEIVDQINQAAVRLIKDIYNIDMEKTQYPKSIDDLPKIDIVITMGCNVTCPIIESDYREDWGLEDPSGKSDDEFRKTIKVIEDNILKLKEKLS